MRLILFFSMTTQLLASFPQIWKGYLDSNLKKEQVVQNELTLIEQQSDLDLAPWQVEASMSRTRNALKNLSPFSPVGAIVDSLGIKLTKPTIDYGTFSIEHRQQRFDLSNWDSRFTQDFEGDLQYEATSILSYSYDFFKNSLKVQQSLVDAQYGQRKAQENLRSEQEALELFNQFIQAKLSLYQVRLGTRNLEEEKKRLKLVKRRNKVGASKKLDLYLAQSAVNEREQTILTARKALEENLSALEYILGKDISEQTFAFVSWKKAPANYDYQLKKNANTELIKANLAISMQTLNQIKDNERSSLKFGLSYSTNGIQNDRYNALEENFEEHTEKVVSLTYTMPLGLSRGERLSKRVALTKKLQEIKLQNSESEIQIQIKAIKKQLQFLSKAFLASQKKSSNLERVKVETMKLFKKGSSSLDELIRRNESLIAAQLQEKQILANFEILAANYAFVTGNIDDYLNKYQDN